MSGIDFVSLDDVRAARERIAPHVRVTPVMRWRDDLWLKLEQLQMGGSFKARGACNRVFAADEAKLAHGVVTASGGNHGLGVAYAATRRGVPSTIYLPERAPHSTERRLRDMGARVERRGQDWDDAWAVAEAHARYTGALLVHPFEDPEVIAGQGTIGLELLEQLERFDVVVVAIGGGGLIGGIALTVKSLLPSVRVVGVEPTGATAMKDSMAAGRLVSLGSVATIAGTLAPRNVGPHTLALASRFVDEVVLVSDAEMKAAMKLLWSEARVLVEPAGAAAVAAVAGGHVDASNKRVAVLVCGANLDTALAAEALG
ncbi:MAG: threonine ammonia-lyase [Polyangia bacterium]